MSLKQTKSATAIFRLVLLCWFSLTAFPVPALAIQTLQDAVRQAVIQNPEVQEKWNAFQAAGYEQDVAEGDWLPSIDLISRLGYEKQDNDFFDETFHPRAGRLALNQLIFDGNATGLNIEKFNHLKLARYYELLDTSEVIALEATRAYLDVLRFQHQLDLASTNYDQHYDIFKQVEERVMAGVGRGVDLQQATGRLALAESNRITEATNLHDVSSRFLRIVGEIPPEKLIKPDYINQNIPDNMQDALRKAFTTHPGFTATMENMKAAQADKKRTKRDFSPKFELNAHHETGHDRDSKSGNSDESVVELRMNFNIFRGGSDLATVRQFSSRVNVAEDQKNKVCRNIRQTLDIAYNDIKRLELQIQQLDQHQKSISNARQAYLKQFDIGQRSLLDLLDSENEYFQAKRAYVSGLYDYQLAFARTQAGMGNLLHSLDIRREEFPEPEGLSSYTLEELDPDAICPPIGVPLRGLGQSRVITAGISREESVQPSDLNTSAEPEKIQTARSVATDKQETTTLDISPSSSATRSVPKPKVAVLPEPSSLDESTQPVEDLDVHFALNKADISTKDLTEIDKIGDLMQNFPSMMATLAGHTDSTGSEVFNYKLSRQRAKAVRDRLIYINNVDPSRILITWYSSKRPVASNDTADGRQKNRRTDAQLIITLSRPEDLKKISGFD